MQPKHFLTFPQIVSTWYGSLLGGKAGLGPLEAVIGTFGEGVADLDPHEAVIDTFGEEMADLDPHKTIIGAFGGDVIDLDSHEFAIFTFGVGVALLDPQEVVIVESAVTGTTRDDEAEIFEDIVQSYNPPLLSTGFVDPAKLIDAGSLLRRSARNENALSKEKLIPIMDVKVIQLFAL